MSGVIYREAPVGIEPTNRGFAVAQERLRYTLSRSVPLHQPGCHFGVTAARCALLVRVVPHLCPRERAWRQRQAWLIR